MRRWLFAALCVAAVAGAARAQISGYMIRPNSLPATTIYEPTTWRAALGLAIGVDVPGKTGAGASGRWGISITGSAPTLGTAPNTLSYGPDRWQMFGNLALNGGNIEGVHSLYAERLYGSAAFLSGRIPPSVVAGGTATAGYVPIVQADGTLAYGAQSGAGETGAPTDAAYITQTPHASLSNEQALSLLSTGILKVTTGTGALSTAAAGDFPTLNQNTTGTAAGLSSAGGAFGWSMGESRWETLAPVWTAGGFIGSLTGNVTGTASGNLTSASALNAANLTGSVPSASLATGTPLAGYVPTYQTGGGVIWSEAAGGGTIWGAVTGELADQTDLMDALNRRVVGPSSSGNFNIAAFNGTSGKSVLDTGIPYTSIPLTTSSTHFQKTLSAETLTQTGAAVETDLMLPVSAVAEPPFVVTVFDGTGFPTGPGLLDVGGELMSYSSRDMTQFTIESRGLNGPAQAHEEGAAVRDVNVYVRDGQHIFGVRADASLLDGAVAVGNGGTGATTAAGARTALGLAIGTDIPAVTGAGASGVWPISVTGNAQTATYASGLLTEGASFAWDEEHGRWTLNAESGAGLKVTGDLLWTGSGTGSLNAAGLTGVAPYGVLAGGTPSAGYVPVYQASGSVLWQPQAGSGAVNWGTIAGTLADQTDLAAALDARQPLSDTLSDIAGLTPTADGQIIKWDATALAWVLADDEVGLGSEVATIEAVLDGGGVALDDGYRVHIEVPYACTVTQITVLADQTGSAGVDVYQSTFDAYDGDPTDLDAGESLVASRNLVSQIKGRTSGLDVELAEGAILTFFVDGDASAITQLTVSLKVVKS